MGKRRFYHFSLLTPPPHDPVASFLCHMPGIPDIPPPAITEIVSLTSG